MGDEAFCGKDIVGRDCAVVGKCNLRPRHMGKCAEVIRDVTDWDLYKYGHVDCGGSYSNVIPHELPPWHDADASHRSKEAMNTPPARCPTCGQPVSKA